MGTPSQVITWGNLNMKKQNNDSSPLDKFHEWDPDWAEKYRKMSNNPWSNGVLPVKLIELICIALNSACTNLQPDATRRHIRAALAAGATREEIWRVAMLVMHFGRPVPEMHSHDATGYWCRDSSCVRSVAPLRGATQFPALGSRRDASPASPRRRAPIAGSSTSPSALHVSSSADP